MAAAMRKECPVTIQNMETTRIPFRWSVGLAASVEGLVSFIHDVWVGVQAGVRVRVGHQYQGHGQEAEEAMGGPTPTP